MKYLKRATRPSSACLDSEATATVAEMIDEVRRRGDAAVREYSTKFDSWTPESFRLEPNRIRGAIDSLPTQVVDDILYVQEQIRIFARAQLASFTDFEVETTPGVHLGQRNLPIASVGAYVPGGRYPLISSAHMTIVTAKAAGVARVATCTPPWLGEIPSMTVAAMHLAGADEIYILGGVQAVAAMGIGTQHIPRVDLIAGPGNALVTEAKRQLVGEIGIDLLAGPAESLIVADDSANALTIAMDLLSHAESGDDSATLLTTSEALARQVLGLVEALLPGLPTRTLAEPAWRDRGQVICVASIEQAWALADSLACENVEVRTKEPRQALQVMNNYGALFLGDGTGAALASKVTGTNHVLPTGGTARHTGGLSVGKFLRTVTYEHIDDPIASFHLGQLGARVARVEGLEAHARAADLRAAVLAPTSPDWFDDALIGVDISGAPKTLDHHQLPESTG